MALGLDYDLDDGVAARESAVRAAQTAIELDPELAEGHAALGLLLLDDTQNNPERAERTLRRALELDPTLSNAYNWLSNALLLQGRVEEANAVLDRGLLVDPLNPRLTMNLAARLRRLGERERAEQLLMRLTHLPDTPGMAYTGLMMLYFEAGEFDKAVRWAKEAVLAHYEYPAFAPMLAWRYENLGLTEDAGYWWAVGLAHTPRRSRSKGFGTRPFSFKYVATWQEYEQRPTSFVWHSALI